MFSDKEESYFEYEIENSDVEGIKLCDDITLNKMRDNDILAKKAINNPNEIYRIEEESIVTGGLETPDNRISPIYPKEMDAMIDISQSQSSNNY